MPPTFNDDVVSMNAMAPPIVPKNSRTIWVVIVSDRASRGVCSRRYPRRWSLRGGRLCRRTVGGIYYMMGFGRGLGRRSMRRALGNYSRDPRVLVAQTKCERGSK